MIVIAWRPILEAATITATSVLLSAALARWSPPILLAASVGTFFAILGWRAVANEYHWNRDIVRFLSIGDLGCLLAGAVVPALLALRVPAASRTFGPALMGGVMGAVVNVVIL